MHPGISIDAMCNMCAESRLLTTLFYFFILAQSRLLYGLTSRVQSTLNLLYEHASTILSLLLSETSQNQLMRKSFILL
jgi:hypothetical protein